MKNINTLNSTTLNKTMLAQNTRLDIVGELEAIIQYQNHIDASNDEVANATLQDIINEEKTHVGQLFGLLFYLDPDSQTYFENGLNEFYSNNSTRQ